MIIICDNCQKEYEAATAAAINAVSDQPGVMDNGLQCPHCQTFTHAYYSNAAMRRKQMDLKDALAKYTKRRNELDWQNYLVLRKEYQALHDALNPVEPDDGGDIV